MATMGLTREESERLRKLARIREQREALLDAMVSQGQGSLPAAIVNAELLHLAQAETRLSPAPPSRQ